MSLKLPSHFIRLALAGVLALSFLAPAHSAPLEVYGRLPQIEDAQLSPDGKLVALMTTKGDSRRIFVIELATMTRVAGVAAGDHRVRAMRWADDDYIIFSMSGVSTVDEQRREVAYGYLFNVRTSAEKTLVFNAPEAQNRIYGDISVRRVGGKTQIFFRTQGLSGGSYDGDVLVMSDPTAKRSVVVSRGDFNQNDWLIGADGKVLVETSYDDEMFRDKIRSKMTINGAKRRHTVRPPQGKVLFGALGQSADGQAIIAYYGDMMSGEPVLGQVSIETGEWLPEILPSDAVGFEFDDVGKLLSYRQLKGDQTSFTFIDPDQARFWGNVEKAFKGSIIAPVSWSKDRMKVVVHVDSPTAGPAFALVDRATMKADWLGDAYALTVDDVSPVRPISYTASDGLEITGYLTLPVGAEPKGLPLIVLPHGGPASRDVPGFDYWSQALASRGYAVLRPNFRGSDGFGVAFLEAGIGQWGRKMQTDLSDGVRYLAAQGTIDPARVCIAGASYGGYAALAGASIDLGVYKCAASVAGPSDLEKMIVSELERDGRQAFKYWTTFMGIEGRATRAMHDISPIKNVDKVTIPVLLIHGKDDTVVPYIQSTVMADALRKAGKSVELVPLEGEDHWLSQSGTRLKMLESLVAFLEKHNPPNRPAQTATASLP